MAEFTGLLLAAGQSRRFGSNKLLAMYRQRPLIMHSAATLSPCDRVIAVVCADDARLLETLNRAGIETVVNEQAGRGMGSSIACGAKASKQSDGWCILPADMPNIPPTVTSQLIRALGDGAALAAPCHLGQRGHPVAFGRTFAEQLQALDGDRGARAIVEQHAEQIVRIESSDAAILQDIDTPLELEQYEAVARTDIQLAHER